MTTIQEIVNDARGMVLGVIPDEYRQSLPIPCMLGNQVVLDFLFLPTSRLAAGQALFPPKVCVRFTHDGDFVRALTINEDELLPGHQQGHSLGSAYLLEKLSYDEYLQHRDRYLNLISQWCQLRQQGLAAQFGKQHALETLNLFEQVSEGPLRDYYQKWGRDFFQSLQQISQGKN